VSIVVVLVIGESVVVRVVVRVVGAVFSFVVSIGPYRQSSFVRGDRGGRSRTWRLLIGRSSSRRRLRIDGRREGIRGSLGLSIFDRIHSSALPVPARFCRLESANIRNRIARRASYQFDVRLTQSFEVVRTTFVLRLRDQATVSTKRATTYRLANTIRNGTFRSG